MTPDLVQRIEQNPWIAAAASVGIGLLGYMFGRERVERDAWPPGEPIVETEVIHSGFGTPVRQRMRRVGHKWIGWNADAPASFCATVDSEGTRMFGVRCRVAKDVPQEVAT